MDNNNSEPLHHLFTQSISQAYSPSCWKVHKVHVVPVFKAGDASCVKNYRPISLLSIVSKVLEKLIVTGFEKTWLPHTLYQTYNFTRN